jgi:hypothetical protein
MGGGRKKRMMEGVNSIMINCKHFINVTTYPQDNNIIF